jgi:DNA-binding CsgD family transcriptional regulator
VAAAGRRAGRLLATARAAEAPAAVVTPDAAAWRALAEAEDGRRDGDPDPARWRAAAVAWAALDRPYRVAYCRWRLAETILAGPGPGGTEASPAEAVRAARAAHATARALRAAPLQREVELLARRCRLDLAGAPPAQPARPANPLGLTAREIQVMVLLTRGYTNREIATELTISVKTASVHVSHILRKLGVLRRVEAAAIAQRLGYQA